MSKNIIIISYNIESNNRIKGLINYLPEFDWCPYVITNDNIINKTMGVNYYHTENYIDRYNILKKILNINNQNVSIKQKFQLDGKKESQGIISNVLMKFIQEIYFYPDPQVSWSRYVKDIVDKIVKSNTIDIVFSSSYPVTCHIVAKRISEKYKIPWIADFRDLWMLNHYRQFSAIRDNIEDGLERKTLQCADCLTTVSRELQECLCLRYPNKKAFSIESGFDLELVNRNAQPSPTNKFTITYTGQLYRGKRDPTILFRALRYLIVNNIIRPDAIEVKFFCERDNWLLEEISKFNLNNIVVVKDRVSFSECIRVQRESQLLLLILQLNNKDELGVVTGKLFEYLPSGRPILCIGPLEGAASRIILETGTGVVCDNENCMVSTIAQHYRDFIERGKLTYIPNTDKILKYSHLEMTRRFIKIFNETAP